ncbi:unnamed protein product [Staurois parvus]|uniref:Secreted protein n=1 Tax=Staurois parvus TaxID=386267 RepID=A0ABN9DAB1_9NEOB|nr:unnamed protein product [Staurois parvus]
MLECFFFFFFGRVYVISMALYRQRVRGYAASYDSQRRMKTPTSFNQCTAGRSHKTALYY